MDRREFLATTGSGAALLSLSTSASAQTPGPGKAPQVVNMTDFGIVAGDSDALARSNSAAVEKLLAYLLANNPTPYQVGAAGIKVAVPAGHFRFARPWELKQALWIEGQSNSQRHGYATHFDFDEAGFVANRQNTFKGAAEKPPTTGADGFRLENLYCTSRAPAGSEFHGLHAVCRGDIIRCSFNAFPGDGLRVETPTAFGGVPTNANSTRILYCQFGGNGGSGIHLMGGDANCIVTIGCDFHANGRYGLCDDSFLSNSHTGHHSEANGLGLVHAGHKMGAVGSACYYPVSEWTAGETPTISPGGTYRASAGKLYRLLEAGRGKTSSAPSHAVLAGAGGRAEPDGYRWTYDGTILTRMYHVAPGEFQAASTTVPGTNPAIWVPMHFRAPRKGIPLWTRGMTWVDGGSYRGTSAAGATVWVACYSEDDQPLAQIRAPAIWIGGQSPPSLWSTCVQQYSNESGALTTTRGFAAIGPRGDGGQQIAMFGHDLANGVLFRAQHETLHLNALDVRQLADTYFILDGVGELLAFTGPKTTFTGGRSTAQVGKTVIPELFVGGTAGSGANARSISVAAAPPAGGHHAAGEIVYNIAPAAGGKVGWVCTGAGTPGTWKAFGAIDP
ncbi:MAG TPA: right-handed parallel beta-helix repeat-containing protein [Allosphingosinicella sp.]|nr:right-handed parallel beta-helix repeat-containing protein [Allosphingosinicella sp.]